MISSNFEHSKEMNLPSSLRSIGQNAFAGCSQLKTPPLPASLTCVEESAFYGCIV